MENKIPIYGMTFAQLEMHLSAMGEKPTKAPFIFQSLYRSSITTLLDIEVINQRLKKTLADTFSITLPRLVEKTESVDTVKFLFL